MTETKNFPKPFHAECAWCMEAVSMQTAIAVLRRYETYYYDAGESTHNGLETSRDEVLYFCNKSHRNEYLYGV